MRRFVLLLALILPPLVGCQAKQEQALAEITRLGGRYRIDEQKPDRPVVMVDLGFTAATDATLEHLKVFPDIQSLYLWNSGITDAGLPMVAGLPRLQKLDLSGTPVTEAGLVHLKSLTQLQELNLKGMKVSDRTLKELRKSLPKTRIVR